MKKTILLLITFTCFNVQTSYSQILKTYTPINGISGNGGYFGRIQGTITGTNCSSQSATFEASTSNDGNTGFNLGSTQLRWTLILPNATEVPLSQFDDQRSISVTTVGGYKVRINICGNGMCSFRNTYISGVAYINVTVPSALSSPIKNSRSNFIGQNIDLIRETITGGNFINCGNILSAKTYPVFESNFNNNPTSYNWYKGSLGLVQDNNNVAVVTSTYNTFESRFTSAQTIPGVYTITATNYCGTSSNQVFTITGREIPSISVASTAITSCLGATINLLSTATGLASGGFLLEKISPVYANLGNLNEVSSYPVTLFNNEQTLGTYRYSATNVCGTASTVNVLVTVSGKPRIIVPLVSATVCSGLSHTFTTTVSGNSLTFRWSNGNTTSENLVTSAAGNYTLTVTSGLCNAVSNTVNLNITPQVSALTGDEEISLNCNYQSGGFDNTQFQLTSQAGSRVKLYKGTTLISSYINVGSFPNNLSPILYFNTLAGSNSITTITSTVENSCGTISGGSYILIYPTVTSATLPAIALATLNQEKTVMATITGISGNRNYTINELIVQWKYNNNTISVSESKDSDFGTAKYFRPGNSNTFGVRNVSNSDLNADFILNVKACASHEFTATNPMRLTTSNSGGGGNTTTPGESISIATVSGITSSVSLSNTVSAILVSVLGSGFVNGATVTVGGVVLTNVSINGNVITGTIPAGSSVINPTNPSIIVQNPGANASTPISLTPSVVNTTNLLFEKSNVVSVYPNPSNNGEFRIENGEFVTVFDMLGKEILSTNESSFKISSKGIFVAQIQTLNGVMFVKLVVE
ncbi:MAG: T9SS C-terminal target domain-containing protein [Bacteroidetes bacterium]|nr:MAG: T9SS C-terminal target domain-containing protein [Bacteroidota bacterium]